MVLSYMVKKELCVKIGSYTDDVIAIIPLCQIH